MTAKFKRVLLKLSGEFLGGPNGFGFDANVIKIIAGQVSDVHKEGVEVAIVVGGGNIFRGANSDTLGMERVTADHIGMLATIMNGLCLQSALENLSLKTRLMTSIEMPSIAEPYIYRRALRHMEKGRVVIFGSGTGNPFFSTDTTAVLRGKEISCDLVIKGTMVDGVYDKDPKKNKEAKKYLKLDYRQVLSENLAVMDGTAISFCREHKLPIYVLDITKPGNLLAFVTGKDDPGTLIQ